MIDPNAINTVRVGQLPEEVWSGTDNLPHEVGTNLKRGTVADLATYIAGIIDGSAGLAFNPLKISDGQTLPVTTVNEWIIVGQGTYLQSGGFPNVVCTDDINIVISNGTSWGLGFGITVEGVDTSQFVKLLGNQTIEDVKTFVQSPIVPTATLPTQAVNFGQLEAKVDKVTSKSLVDDTLITATETHISNTNNPHQTTLQQVTTAGSTTNVLTTFEDGINVSGGNIGVESYGGDIGINVSGGNIGVESYGGDIGISASGGNIGVESYGGDIGIKANGQTGNAGIFNIPTENASNIVEFKKNNIDQAAVTHDGKIIGADATEPNQMVTLGQLSNTSIPLSGTEVGKPITGDLEMGTGTVIKSYDDIEDKTKQISFQAAILEFSVNDDDNVSGFAVEIDAIRVSGTSPSHVGITGNQNFSPNITDLDYTQKIYVDNAITAGAETTTTILTKIGNGALIDQQYLPSFVDDVLEFANLASFPVTGAIGKIYIAIDTSKQYRWTGSLYLQITNGLIGSTNDVPEGSTNLYFTTARVLATLLNGLPSVTGGIIVSTDSVLIAFEKLRNQIMNNLAQLHWTKTGDNIRNNNVGNVELLVGLGGGNDGEVGIYDRDTPTIKRASITSRGVIKANNYENLNTGAGMFFDGLRIVFTSFETSSQLPLFAFNPTYLGSGVGAPTTGELNVVGFTNQTVNPTSGNRVFNFFNLSPTINQTGGANGITRGIYINPTLTAATDFRALEITSGKVIIPPATASNEAVNLSQLRQGYQIIASSATPINLTSASPKIIEVTGTLAQVINLPVTSTLSLGFDFKIVNNGTGTITVNSSGGNAFNTIATGISCDFYCELLTGTTTVSWQQNFSGGTTRTGAGSLVYGDFPALRTPSYSLSATFTAGTNAQGQGGISTDVTVITIATSNPSGVTLFQSGQQSRHVTLINKGTNPVNIYPPTGNQIDALGTNMPYLLPVNGVMVFRSISATQWYSELNNGIIKLRNYTVATLPAGTQGDTAYVTDALAPTYLTTVMGGGAIVTPVFHNGTNWVCQ